jgi:sulfide:quinone oxidoreductase
MRILVLGAGFGGLELTTRLSDEFGDDVEITLIDKGDAFVFGFSKLDVMFGRTTADHVRHRYADIVKPGVTFVQTQVRAIDPVARRAETDAGTFDADILVVGLGADYDLDHTPGLAEGGHEFYSVPGAFAARDLIAGFEGGRVIVGVISTPFKCPPAPSETSLLMRDLLVDKGVWEDSSVSLVMPFGRPIPPSPEASEALLGAFEERGIEWCPQQGVTHLDPDRKIAHISDGSEKPYDLFLGVPHHVAPEVVVASGMTTDGWIAVDPLTLETQWPDVYAIGDVAAVGTPRAGVFAEGHAAVAADRIAAKIRNASSDSTYGGRGICYLEFGDDQVALVDVTFFGDDKTGKLVGPSAELVKDKIEFGRSRVERWFGREWSMAAAP